MRKFNTKKLVITGLLALLIIIELLALGISKAEKTKEIELNVSDYEGKLKSCALKINAFDSGESGYYIVLPEFIDAKQIDKYIIEEKAIISEENEEENIIEETNKAENIVNETSIKATTEGTKTEKVPGDELYITQKELENQNISLQAIYKTKNVENNILYNTKLEQVLENEGKTITVQGYMPLNTTMQLNEIAEEASNILNKVSIENFMLQQTYNIKLINNDEEYVSNSQEDIYKIIISEMDETKDYQVFQIVKNVEDVATTTTQEIKSELVEKGLNFNIQSFEPFAIFESNLTTEIQEETQEETKVVEKEISTRAISATTKTWDGSIATSFSIGEGTKTYPYLISTGAELAYLASKVNAGTTYENVYFQLINSINLNGIEWTPIGNIANSFRGIFDGAGYTISNATITIGTIPTVLTTYGIFGSIGGGTTRTIVENVEFDSINVSLTATTGSGSAATSSTTTDKGYHIGIVAGTMYKNSSIINVIAKNSTISNTQRITLANSYFRVAIGGICGIALNTSSSETDPGAGARYAIENCYSDVDIDILIRDNNGNMPAFGQYATGGVIRYYSFTTCVANKLFIYRFNYIKGIYRPNFCIFKKCNFIYINK